MTYGICFPITRKPCDNGEVEGGSIPATWTLTKLRVRSATIYTPQSIRDFDHLATELVAIRGQGYSTDNGERNHGTTCVAAAAPIRDQSGGVVAALSVTSKVERLTEAFRAESVPRVGETADRISFRLGHLGSTGYL